MRRRRATKRTIDPDPVYNSLVIAKFVNMVMVKGKKSKAESIVYECLDLLAKKTNKDAIEVFDTALDNSRPLLEVKARRIGGATYQVPVEVKKERGIYLALRWIRDFARAKKGKSMAEKLADELSDAYNNQGSAIKKREDTHKMAEANKAFAHYRW